MKKKRASIVAPVTLLTFVVVTLLAFAITSPVCAQLDFNRFSAPDIQELFQLAQKEEWEAVIAKGEPLLTKLEQQGDKNGVYFVSQQIWLAYFNVNETQKALKINAKSKFAYYELTKDDPNLGKLATVQYANALATSGRVKEAIQFVDAEIQKLPPESENRDLLVFQKGIALYLSGKTGEASAVLAEDGEKQMKLATTNQGNKSVHLFVAGNELLLAAEMLDAEGGDFKTIRAYGSKALEAFKPIAQGATVKVGMRGDDSLLPRAYAAAGEYPKALELYRGYVDKFVLNPQTGAIYTQKNRYQAHAVLGLWEDRGGNVEKAIEHYLECVDSMEKTWARLSLQTSKESFLASAQPFYIPRGIVVYERLIQLLLKKGEIGKAFEYAELSKASSLRDLLGRRSSAFPSKASPELLEKERRLFKELQKTQKATTAAAMPGASPASDTAQSLTREYLAVMEQIRSQDPEYAGLLASSPVSVKEIQTILDKDTALVEYFIGIRDSAIWIVTPTSVQGMVLAAGQGKVSDLVSAARRGLLKPGPPKVLQQDLKALSSLVIAPVLPKLSAQKRLVVVPHAALHYVPFSALRWTDASNPKGVYLVEKYEIVNSPSASVLVFCQKKNPRRTTAFALGSSPALLLALGNTRPDVGQWDPLPGTAKEVRMIQKLLPQAKIYEGAEMKSAAIQEDAPKEKLLHFATHGKFDLSDPTKSCLVLSDAELAVPDIFRLKLEAYSVTLSACQTGLGQITAGDDVIGLTRAFLYAGTPAVVSTLWKIADDPTAQLMASFYQNLTKVNRSAALRNAQLSLLKAKDQRLAHPFFWGAFVITGDWQ